MYHVLDGQLQRTLQECEGQGRARGTESRMPGKAQGKGFYRWSAEDSKEPAAIHEQWQQGEDCWPWQELSAITAMESNHRELGNGGQGNGSEGRPF